MDEALAGPDAKGPVRASSIGAVAGALEAREREEAPAPGPMSGRLLVLQEPFSEPGLIAALAQRGYDVEAPRRRADPWQAVRDVERAPDVVVVPIGASDVEEIRRLRRLRLLEAPPFLGVTAEHPLAISVEALRRLGVAGLVHRRTGLAHLLFRLEQLLRPPRAVRRYERVPVFLPVTARLGAVASRVLHAHSLSVGGMGLLGDEPLAVNTDLSLRFELLPGATPIRAAARVVYCHASREAPGLHRIGIFFYPLVAEEAERLAAFVDREVLARRRSDPARQTDPATPHV